MCGLLLSADMESCCPSAWSCLSAYMEYEVSAVKGHLHLATRRDRLARWLFGRDREITQLAGFKGYFAELGEVAGHLLVVRPGQDRREVEVLTYPSDDRRLGVLGSESGSSVGIHDQPPWSNQDPTRVRLIRSQSERNLRAVRSRSSWVDSNIGTCRLETACTLEPDVGLVGARPVEQKKGADRGIDGRLFFHDEQGDKTKQAILSVKAGHVNVSHVPDLRGMLDCEQALSVC